MPSGVSCLHVSVTQVTEGEGPLSASQEMVRCMGTNMHPTRRHCRRCALVLHLSVKGQKSHEGKANALGALERLACVHPPATPLSPLSFPLPPSGPAEASDSGLVAGDLGRARAGQLNRKESDEEAAEMARW
jgi:hypothetical protein